MGKLYKCNSNKCVSLLRVTYVKRQNCEIISLKASPRVIKEKLKYDPNFCPHLIAVEKQISCSIRNALSFKYEPAEALRGWDEVNSKRSYVNANFANIVIESISKEILQYKKDKEYVLTLK